MTEEFVRLDLEQYKIFKNNGYYLCISDLEQNNYQLYIGFTDQNLNNLSKEEIITKIRKISDLINSVNKSGIYVLPIISPDELEQAALENDDTMFYKIMSEKIQPITKEIYEMLKNYNKKLDTVIRMIKQTDVDRKFIDWLDMKLMESGIDYIDDVEYLKLKAQALLKENDAKKIDSPDNKNEGVVVLQEEQKTNVNRVAPIDRTHDNTMSQTKTNNLVRRLVKPKDNQTISSGFSNIGFIIILLSAALVLGIGISYLIIK